MTALGMFFCIAVATSYSLSDEQRSQRFKSLARARDKDTLI